jgi:phage shock protein PspC (stress-responsive transcriptional regulator)
MEPGQWHRDHEGRRLGGVACGVARALALPVTPVRLAFVILTFLHFLGPVLYAALWLVMPYAPGDEPPYAQALVRAKRFYEQLFGHHRGGRRRPPSPPDASGTEVGGPVP